MKENNKYIIPRIINGNVYFNVGGNYVRQSQFGTAQNYVTGDFSLDWFLTDDKRLKFEHRFYFTIFYILGTSGI